VLLCVHDALDRFLVLEENDVGVAAVVVADQDSPEDSVLLLYKEVLELVGCGEERLLGDSVLELEGCECDVHVAFSPFAITMLFVNTSFTVIFDWWPTDRPPEVDPSEWRL
jgi:hypothetical protein